MTSTVQIDSQPAAPPRSFDGGGIAAILLMVALGVVALVLARRRQGLPRRMEALESLSLGPRRSLCLARVENQLLVLGVSEAGVQLLTTLSERPAALEETFARLLERSDAEQRAADPGTRS